PRDGDRLHPSVQRRACATDVFVVLGAGLCSTGLVAGLIARSGLSVAGLHADRDGRATASATAQLQATAQTLSPHPTRLRSAARALRKTLQPLTLLLTTLTVLLTHALTQVFELLSKLGNLLIAQLFVRHAIEILRAFIHVLGGLCKIASEVARGL